MESKMIHTKFSPGALPMNTENTASKLVLHQETLRMLSGSKRPTMTINSCVYDSCVVACLPDTPSCVVR